MQLLHGLARWKDFKWLRKPISFKKAFVLSIVCHFLLLLFCALIVSLFNIPLIYNPPLVFDFAYVPSEGLQTVTLQGDHLEDSAKPKQAQTKSEQRPHPRQLNDAETVRSLEDEGAAENAERPNTPEVLEEATAANLAANATAVVDQTVPETSDSDVGNDNYVPEARNRDQLTNPYVISRFKPLARYLPPFDVRNPNLVPARIAMTKRQRERLQKQVKKLSYKLNELGVADSLLVWSVGGQQYDVKVRRLPTKSNTGLDEILVEISTQENGHQLTTEMRLKRLAFSSFAQFVDYWDPRVAVHNDELVGRFHSNTTFAVSNRFGVVPKFYGKVTTAGFRVRSGGSFPFFDRESIFLGGLETGVRPIHVPKHFLPAVKEAAADSSRYRQVSGETWITFNGDGTYSWRDASAHANRTKNKIPNDTAFIISGDKKSVIHVKGVVNGKILVYSAKRIIIDGSLNYAQHPEVSPFADDYLGLVSEKNIEIAHPSVTGPGDLYIFASMFAKRRFVVRNIYGHGEAKLYIYGSLSAGSLSATEPRYATHVQFDKRLESRRPPNFPMTDKFELNHWDGTWHLK
ncbi:MAG: hypothetical protein ACE5HO_06410 [bacterium]